MKEPPSPRLRKKPTAATSAVASRKLRLFCSFNGAFRLTPPYNKLRYVGGDTRVLSFDRNNIGFSKLRSKIRDLCPKLKSFSLKYKLPVCVAAGDDTDSDDWDEALVSISSDEDVRYMIEECEKIELYGKHARLWLFVCKDNNNNSNNNNKHDNEYGCEKKNDDDFYVNFGGVRCCDDSLRKTVLKQQVLPKGNNNGIVGCEDVGSFFSGEDKDVKYDHPLIDLENAFSVISEEEPYLDHKKRNAPLSGNDIFGDLVCCAVPLSHPLNSKEGNLAAMENNGPMPRGNVPACVLGNGSATGNSSSFGDPHVDSMCSGLSAKQETWDSEQRSLNSLNWENIMPCAVGSDLCSNSNQLDGSANPVKSSCVAERVRGDHFNGIQNHRFGLHQRVHPYQIQNHRINMIEMDKESQQSPLLDGRLSAGKCHPELSPDSNLSNQVQPVKSYFTNSWRTDCTKNVTKGGPRMLGVGLNSFFDLTRQQTCAGLPVLHHGNWEYPPAGNQSLVYHNVGSSPASCVGAITQGDLLTGSQCNMHDIPNGSVIEISSGPLIDFQHLETTRECKVELSHSKNGTHNLQGAIASSVDLLYKLSTSSSKEVEMHSLSSLAPDDLTNNIIISDLKSLGHVEEERSTSASKADKSQPIAQNRAKNEKDQAYEEEIQQDPPSGLIIDEQAETKEIIKESKAIGGISNELAAIYSHLATQELQIIKNSDLEYIKELGSGTYGTVYYGKWKGSDVAIKKIKPSSFTSGSLGKVRLVADFWKEAYILGQLHHPNIVAFYGVVTDGPVNNLATVTEYMVNGSLKQVLRRKDRTIDRRKRLIIAMDAAFGMEYLHEKNIVHFDLKSHNFLVNMRDPQRPICKIGDLGLSKIKQRTLVSGGVRGTIPWMAPELLNSKNNMVTEKVDVYSFGIVMWELLTGEEPYSNLRSEEIIVGIIKDAVRPEIPSWCDPAWRSLMLRCWSSDPDARPSFSEIAKELRAMAAAMNIK